MFVYPGHLKTVIWEHHSHEETKKNFEGGFSYQSRGLLMSDHGPTHVDALSHLDPNPEEPSIDKMPLALFYGPASAYSRDHFGNKRHPPNISPFYARADTAIQQIQVIQVIQVIQMIQTSWEMH